MSIVGQQKVLESWGKIRVLSVGVTAYKPTSGFRPLTKAAADAKAVMKAFTNRSELNADSEHSVLLSSDEDCTAPSRGEILGALHSLANEAEETHRILFYFSGHGHRLGANSEGYLVPQDAYSSQAADCLISIPQVLGILESSNARQKVVILDACFSGPTLHKGKGSVAKLKEKQLADYLSAVKGVLVLTSCMDNEEAWENSRNENLSLFTHFLVEGLHGHEDALDSGLLTGTSLYEYLSVKVRQGAKQLHLAQTPSWSSKGAGVTLLGNFRRNEHKVESSLDQRVSNITLTSSFGIRANEILTSLSSSSPRTVKQLEFAANTNGAMTEYFDGDFKQYRTQLRTRYGYQADQIKADGGRLEFPCGSLDHTVKMVSKSQAEVHQTLTILDCFEFQKVKDLAEIFGVSKCELSISLAGSVLPLKCVAVLEDLDWDVKGEDDDEVVAQSGQAILTLSHRTLAVTALDFRTLDDWPKMLIDLMLSLDIKQDDGITDIFLASPPIPR